MINLIVRDEFTKTPGHRSPADGSFSGEEFLQKLLCPKYEAARRAGTQLRVDLDGAAGYATSFLEASFGGLARMFPIGEVNDTLLIESQDDPLLKEEIREYIADARTEQSKA